MIRNSFDIASRVSAHLSALIESRSNDPDVEQPVTLAGVRTFIAGMLSPEFREAERLHHFDLYDSILDELDALIEEFGTEALASDFEQHAASASLARVIEAIVDDDTRGVAPTLQTVKEALASGRAASLIGEGVLEADEDENLVAEIDALIERFGTDSPAEDFLAGE
jgi:hypothetical protein